MKSYWKNEMESPAFFGKIKIQQKENYGLHLRKCPPTVEDLVAFEEDVRLMIKNTKFRKVNNEF